MSSISSFNIICVVVLLLLLLLRPYPKTFLCIPASTADAAAVNSKGIKTLLANGLITFFINSNPVLVMDRVIYQEIRMIVSSLISELLSC